MKRLKRIVGVFLRGIGAVWFGLSVVLSGGALAQTTGALNPAPADPAVKEDVPPRGCMPIGMTAAGEMVFPIQCAALIAHERGKAIEQKPVLANEAPSAKPSGAATPEKPAEAAAPEKPPEAVVAEKISEAAAPKSRKPSDDAVEKKGESKSAKRERRSHAANSVGCEHYRTYDRESGTFRDYDGRRRSCQ
jgi:hypothetical protein